MVALYLLIALGLICIWFAVSPLFNKIGNELKDTIKDITEEENE